jgi:Na+-transporting methylmalonyl-CoA/oxaloacetate decarboxylase gamma subunit
MEWLTPDMLGGAGVGMGGIFLFILAKMLVMIGRVLNQLSAWIETHSNYMTAAVDHYKAEEKHQERVEKQLDLIAGELRAVPRPVYGDHTPRPVDVSPAPSR